MERHFGIDKLADSRIETHMFFIRQETFLV